MIKNRIPLRNLLAFVLIVVVFFMGCMAYALSFELGRRGGPPDIFFYMFLGLSFFFFISILGLLSKGDGGRILLKIILFLLIISWTIFAGYLTINSWKGFEKIEKILLVVLSIVFYIFLVSGILFLNNDKLKEELE